MTPTEQRGLASTSCAMHADSRDTPYEEMTTSADTEGAVR